MTTQVAALMLVAVAASARPAAAQAGPDVFLRGVPAGHPSATVLPLSLTEAVHRGLDQNLGVVLEQERVRAAGSARLTDLSGLLPHVSAGVRESDTRANLAAFGFTGFPGIPQVIGPFPVFDARVFVSAPLFDAAALGDLRAGNALVRAEEHTYRQTRETVVLVVCRLYLDAVTDAARVASARSQVTSADALLRLAQDQKASGLVAGIDVVRQQVQLESARARLIGAENALGKAKLALARAIGVPAGQDVDLTDHVIYAPAPALTVEAALTQATATRDDVKSAEAKVDAARAVRQSALGTSRPSVHLDADIGALGSNASTTARTYSVAASVRVPIFNGGSERAKVQQADADLKQREAELADLRAGLQYDIAEALLDLTAADAGVQVAQNAEGLARQQLDQAQDRFRAGVASSLELVESEESVAKAAEQFITSLYNHAMAKAALARALGQVEARFPQIVGGRE